jgi:hypothetical protein
MHCSSHLRRRRSPSSATDGFNERGPEGAAGGSPFLEEMQPGDGRGGQTGPMDITTVNDRHLYQGRVVVRDPADPSRSMELTERIVRFGPAGWLTVTAVLGRDAEIELYPTEHVLAVTGLREVGATEGQLGADR